MKKPGELINELVCMHILKHQMGGRQPIATVESIDDAIEKKTEEINRSLEEQNRKGT